VTLGLVALLFSCFASHERERGTDAGASPPDGGADGGPAPAADAGVTEGCPALEWRREVVDDEADRYGGFAVAFAPGGELHLVYAKAGTGIVHAARTGAGFARDSIAERAQVRTSAQTVDALVAGDRIHAVYFGPGPDTPATAVWHASGAPGGWSADLVTPWVRLFNRVSAPHLSIDAIDGGEVGIAYRGLVDHVAWSRAGGYEVELLFARGAIATAFAPDGRRAHAFTEGERIYEGGRVIEVVWLLHARFGDRRESIEVAREGPEMLGAGCSGSGIDVVASEEALDVFFPRPLGDDRCTLAHLTLAGDEAPRIEAIAVPAGGVSAAAIDGEVHLASSDGTLVYATGREGAWSVGSLGVEARRARIAVSDSEIAIAFVPESEDALEVVIAERCD
jgi:hypothetical protein